MTAPPESPPPRTGSALSGSTLPGPGLPNAELMERGRKLFAAEARFVGEARSPELLPPPNGPEVGFAGRSNVGKSSLLNALTNRQGLARASSEPGRTRAVNFFELAGGALFLVDLPGYGFARAPKTEIERWNAVTRDYLRGRANLRRVLLLVDSRHGAKESDEEVMTALDRAAVSYALVLTKTDKIHPRELSGRVEALVNLARRHPAAYPIPFPTSAETGYGIPELRGALAEFADPPHASLYGQEWRAT